MRYALTLALLAMIPTGVRASEIQLVLKTAAGQPVQDAVVTYKPAQASSRPVRFDWPNVVAQHNIAFEPHVLIVPVGADVSFPNRDRVRHHVYSFSAAKRFELKLYGGEQTRTVHFDKTGVVALGCNIHDQMSGYIVVVDTPFAAKTDAAGRVVIKGAPDGAGTLNIWQSALKAPLNTISRPLSLHGDAQQTLTLDLRPETAMVMPH